MKTNLLNLFTYFNFIFCLTTYNLSFSQAIISEASFEDNSLPDFTGDGRDSWRVPDNNAWSPNGFSSPVIQINSDPNPLIEPNLPEGVQAAKFPASGDRVAYQEIEVTPGKQYALTYYNAFEIDTYGEMKVSILKPNTSSYAEAQLSENIIASRLDNNINRIDNIFKKHAIIFEAGENESVIIFATNTGVESRLDAFDIITDPSLIQNSLTTDAINGTIMVDPEPTNGTYDYGTEVTITATPNEGYLFDNWNGDASGTTNPLTIIMCGSKSIEAFFSKTQHTLTTEALNGTITLNPEPVNGTYQYGTEITLTAIPDENYAFEGWWFGYSETSDNLTITIEKDITVAAIFPKIDETFVPNPIIKEASFEDNSLPDGTGDGRDSWRTPNKTDWNLFGGGTTVIQITTRFEEGIFPNGFQAAKLPDEERVAYQKIDITQNTEYILTFYSIFELLRFDIELDGINELNVSILKPDTNNYSESLLQENIIASKTFNSVGRLDEVFEKHFIQFDSKEFESVIIFITRNTVDNSNSGYNVKFDAFEIIVNSTANSPNLSVIDNENTSTDFSISPNPTSDYINIKVSNLDSIQETTVINMLGEEIFKTNETKIDVSNLPNGLYLLKIEDKNSNIVTRKFVKH